MTREAIGGRPDPPQAAANSVDAIGTPDAPNGRMPRVRPCSPQPTLVLSCSVPLQPALVLFRECVQELRLVASFGSLQDHEPLGVLGVVLAGERLAHQLRLVLAGAEAVRQLGGDLLGGVTVGQHKDVSYVGHPSIVRQAEVSAGHGMLFGDGWYAQEDDG
jgi:hypothetical protein